MKKKSVCCRRCSRILPKSEMKLIKGKNIYVCENCAEDKYRQCNICKDYFSEHDLFYTDDSQEVCSWCLTKEYILCPHCTNFFHFNNMAEFHGYYICNNCKKDLFEKCKICNEFFESDELEQISLNNKYKIVCHDCLSKTHVFCVECGEIIPKEESEILDENIYCTSCFNNICNDDDEYWGDYKDGFNGWG